MNKFIVVSLAGLLAFAAANVVRFEREMKDDVDELMTFLGKNLLPERYRSDEYFHRLGLNPKYKLKEFKWDNCGDPTKESFIVKALSIGPDPVKLPGPMDISFTADVKSLVDSPLVADVLIEKKAAGSWIKLPCIDQFGSCNYTDFCDILAMIPQCPAAFTEHGVPCQCPFKVGNYTLPKSTFNIGVAFLPSGDYHGRINMTMNSNPVGCYEIYMTIVTNF